jgi:hypothetical protein
MLFRTPSLAILYNLDLEPNCPLAALRVLFLLLRELAACFTLVISSPFIYPLLFLPRLSVRQDTFYLFLESLVHCRRLGKGAFTFTCLFRQYVPCSLFVPFDLSGFSDLEALPGAFIGF